MNRAGLVGASYYLVDAVAETSDEPQTPADRAELTGLSAEHLDKNFELIASWSGQPTGRLSVSL